MFADDLPAMTPEETAAWEALNAAAWEIVGPAIPRYAAAWLAFNAPSGASKDQSRAIYDAALPQHIAAIEAMLADARTLLLAAVEAHNAAQPLH